MTATNLRTIVRQLADRLTRLESGRGFQVGTVTGGDQTQITVDVGQDEIIAPPPGNYIPEVGQTVIVASNGRDPVILPPIGQLSYGAPSGPQAPTVDGTLKGISIEWYPSPEASTGTNTKYQVHVYNAARTYDRMFDVSGTYLAVTGLVKNTRYYVEVRAVTVAGDLGEWSPTGSAVAGVVGPDDLDPQLTQTLTDAGNAAAAAQDALETANDAKAIADGKVVTFAQPGQPTGGTVGDIWIDTDAGNRLWRHDGTSWTDMGVSAGGVNFTARDIGAITTYYQTETPTGAKAGDLWVDTDAGNVIYRYNGSSWNSARDAGIDTAIGNASAALSTANGKGKVYWQSSAPSGASTADIWFDTANDHQAHRWNGSSWLDATFGDGAISGLNVSKLVAGTVQAAFSMTAGSTTGARVVFSATGIRSYNSSNELTFSVTSSGGTGRFTGNVYADLFKGNNVGSLGYIEMGNTGPTDPVEEVRMFSRSSTSTSTYYVASMRNPSVRPGKFRFSSSTPYGLLAMEFGAESSVFKALTLDVGCAFYVDGLGFKSGQARYLDFVWGSSLTPRMFIAYPPGNNTGGASLGFSGQPTLKGHGGNMEVRTNSDAAFAPLQASNVALSSDPRTKRNIRQVPVSQAAADLRRMKLYDYEVEIEDGIEDPNDRDSRRNRYHRPQRGFMSTDLPARMVSNNNSSGTDVVDLYDIVVTIAGAVQEIDSRLVQLEIGR